MTVNSAFTMHVIRGQDPPPGLWAGLADLARYREVLVNLAVREIRVRYKQSALGVAWAVMQPVMMMVVFAVVFSRFAKLPSEGLPYPVFAYAALLPWTFCAAGTSTAMASIVGSASLIKKVYFPRAVLPLASILTHGADFAISTAVFVLLLAYYRVSVTASVLYVVPLLLLQLAFMVGLALLLAGLNAYYRDVRYVFPVLMQMWLYATPVAWSMTMVPDHLRIPYAALNPMAAIIDGFRTVVLHGTPPVWSLVGAAAGGTILLLIAAHRYFAAVERNIADIV